MLSRSALPQASIDSIAGGVRGFFFFFASIAVILLTEKVDIEWKWAHLFFDYDYGFLKRGLVGELIDWTPIDPSLENFKAIAVLLLLGVAVAFYQLIKDMPNKEFFGFSFLFLFSPLLFRNYVFDWGRYDQLAIIFVFLLIRFSEDDSKSRWFLYASPLLLFIHEGFVFWVFPIILTIALLQQKSTLYKLLPILLFSGVCILTWGGLDIDPDEYYLHLQEWAKPHSIHQAIVFTFTPGISDVISEFSLYAGKNLTTAKGYKAIFFLFLSVLPLTLIADKRLLLLGLLGVVSSGVLLILGADIWRWVSLMATSAMFFLLYAYKKSMLRTSPALGYYLMLAGLIGLVSAPIGIHIFH